MKMEHAAKILVALFFAALTIVGLSYANDYGLPQSCMEMRDAAVFAPLAAVEENHQPHAFKALWQGYTWLIFMVGLWALYGFCRAIGMGRLFSCMGVLTLYFCPRFFAEGHYGREMVLMALLLCVLWLGLRFAQRPTGMLRAMGLAFAGALATNLVSLSALVWLMMIVCAAVPLTVNRGWNRRTICAVLYAAVCFEIFCGLMGIGAGAEEAAKSVLFGGKVYEAGEALPWYAPLWTLALTLPLFALPLFGCGQAAVGIHMKRHWRDLLRDVPSLAQIAVTLCWVITLLAALFSPTLRSDWRMYGFLYAGLAVMMARGVMDAYRFGRHFGGDCGMHLVFFAGILLFFGWTARDMYRNHPYEYAYYNRIGHNIAVRQMELDSENVSAYNALQALAQLCVDTEEAFTVGAGDSLSRSELENAYAQLSPAEKEWMVITNAQDADYLYVNTSYFRLSRSHIPRGYQKLLDLKSYDLIISSIYQGLRP